MSADTAGPVNAGGAAPARVPAPEQEATASGPERRPRPSGLRAWVRPILLLALAGFAVWALVANRVEVAAALRQLSPAALAAALILAFATNGTAALVWRALMADFGHRLPVLAAARIFCVSQLGKYVPGSVWSIVAQIELSREHRIPKRTNVAVGVLIMAIAATVGLCVGALLLPFVASSAAHRYWWLLLLIPVFVAALHPAVLGRALNLALRLVRREPLPRTPSIPGLARVVGLQVLVWLLLGLQVWLLLVGLGAPAWQSLPVAVGGYATAYSLGMLAVGLPAGAGVREVALTVMLSAVVPPATALVVALLARVLMIVVDLTVAGAFAIPWRRRTS